MKRYASRDSLTRRPIFVRPVAYALTELSADDEARIGALIKRAVS
ncbi:hypothetical protein N5079_06690 [Planotetraspora sp. A-T 1434]|nr:hypothetical protein [Planotetraspora sp. A-T 1434]MCT9929905.1 hypothetical protein [Planotetraspora sp. A-T 1434]